MARKNAFVNEMLLQSLKQNQQTTSPVLKTITKIDDAIKSILENDDLDEYAKVRMYSQALQQYRNTRQNLNEPQKNDSRINTAVVESINDISNPYEDSSILETIPKTFRSKAKNLLRFIKNDDRIKWDERGVVTFNGETMAKSNIIDLMNDVTRPRKLFEPDSWKRFAGALHAMNVPKDLIGNPKRQNILYTDQGFPSYIPNLSISKQKGKGVRQRRQRRVSPYVKWDLE